MADTKKDEKPAPAASPAAKFTDAPLAAPVAAPAPVQAQAQAAEAAQPKNTSTETVPGGRYMVGGRLVDCNGRPIKDDKAKDKADSDEDADASPKDGETK